MEIGLEDKRRNSNIELLRILSMLMVMLIHACFMSVGLPSPFQTINAPVETFAIFCQESLSVVCVNTFILISGWFGIYWKRKKLLSLLFQVFFFSALILVVLTIYAPAKYLSTDKIGTVLMIHASDYWFVKSYVILYVFSPVLNCFLESLSRRKIECFLLLFYLMQSIYGWVSINGAAEFQGGYSALSFFGLYALARYIRIYGIPYMGWSINRFSWKQYLFGYFVVAFFLAVLGFVVTRLGLLVAGRIFTYTNPLVVLESLCLLLAFSVRKPFYNKRINWLAGSCLAVYLFHGNELILRPYYAGILHGVYVESGFFRYSVFMIVFIVIFFVISICLDRIRLKCWRIIDKSIC